MTNMNYVSRTNNFRVKDAAAFISDLDKYEVVADMGDTTLKQEHDGTFTIFFHDGEPELFPQNPDEPEDVKELVASHLVEGEVAVFIELANEGMHTISAFGTVLTHKNERKEIDLIVDIFKLARSLGNLSGTLDD